MRSFLRSLLPLALVLAVAGCEDTSKDKNERRVVIFFTTDEHSQLFASSPELDDFILMQNPTAPTAGKLKGGVARRMTILKAQRDAVLARGSGGENVGSLTLSSGDFSQGSLASAAWLATSPELAAMKLMGYDAVALGNHEFDLGPTALAQAVQSAASLADGSPQRPPLVLTNINFSTASTADDGLEALYGVDKPIAPYRILTTSNGLRIGIVASMGVAAGTVAGAPAPVTFFSGANNTERFGSIAAKLQATIDTVRAQGVDAVVLLGHGGIGPDAMHPGEDETLALSLKGVDLVLSGHSHLFTPQPRIVYGSGTAVPVVQPKPYGHNVGKVELVFVDDDSAPRPYLDPNGTKFFEVDDRTAPTTDAAFMTDLQTRTVGYLAIGGRARVPTLTTPSFLEKTLATITGAPVTPATPATAANLWNYPLGRLDFDVIGNAPGETNAMNLDTDAILAAVRAPGALIGIPPAACTSCAATEIAIQASGPIRGDLKPSSYEPNKALTFADIYHVVPLGGDPTATTPTNPADPEQVQAYLNAVPGYPIVRVNIPTAALRAAIEGTLQTGLLVNGDFFPGASGLLVEYDLTRPVFNPANPVSPGWVKYMALQDGATTTVLYDPLNPAYAASGGFAVAPTSFRSVATTLYVAGVAQALGIPMYNDTGTQLTTVAQLATMIVRQADGGAIKDYVALGQYVAVACATNAANPGFLPSVYDATTAEGAIPRRMVDCTAGCP
jgi:2',3'-cyclic-nucleotide 2'-phosphodiesterase (5'-nucleotidase family)